MCGSPYSMSGSLSSMGGSCLQQREAAAASAYPYMFHDPLSSLSSTYQRSSSQLASCGNAASQAAVSSFNAASHAAAASYAAATSSAGGTGTGEFVLSSRSLLSSFLSVLLPFLFYSSNSSSHSCTLLLPFLIFLVLFIPLPLYNLLLRLLFCKRHTGTYTRQNRIIHTHTHTHTHTP